MEKQEYTQQMIDQIILNVIGYSQANGDLLNKYNDHFFLSYFDRLKIDETIKKITSHQKQLQTAEFVRLFLSVIEHKPEETLYLAISLTKLYKKIKEEVNNEKGVKFSDFTSFLCNKIAEGDPDLVVPMREIPIERVIPDISKVRDIDINPPPILSKVEVERPKITKDKNKKDKKLEEKKPVAKFIYSHSLNSIIILGRLSSSITLYNPKDLKIQHKIVPSTCRVMSKDVAILSIAFSERDQRIGCIINNIGITFWQAADNFTTEKLLGANKSEFDSKTYGDKIYYLALFNQWVTTDRDTIYFWDIKQEQVTRTIKRANSTAINDICEINHIRALLVSYNIDPDNAQTDKSRVGKLDKFQQHEQKLLVVYQDGKQKSKLVLPNPGCHSICYNPSTQLVVCLGYQSLITVYEVDAKTYDINIIAQLKGHTSILTSISSIGNTPMIITGDDIGHLKLWELNYMRCLQSIRIAKAITQLCCTGSMLIYADSRINTIPMDVHGQKILACVDKDREKEDESYGIYQFYRKEEQSLWIITRKEAREIDINNGRIKNILVLCNNQEDISAAAEVYNGFLVGTSKGEMSKYSLDGEKKWKVVAHEGEISAIRVDIQNHLIATIGGDNTLHIWPEKTIIEEQTPRKRISFQQKDINLLQMCPYANLLLIGSSTDNKLIIWNYDNLKLAYIVSFDCNITSFLIMPDKHMFIVATVEGHLYLFVYGRKEAKLKIILACVLNINEVYLEKSEKQIQQQQKQQPATVATPEGRAYLSKLTYSEDSNLVIGATARGKLYCISPDNFYSNPNYKREYEPAPTMKRPMKESYEHQLLKNQYLKLSIHQMQAQMSAERASIRGTLTALWYNQVHKDSVNFLSIVSLQKKYASTLCVDGYFKLIELGDEEGLVVCSHKISFPLPVKWQLDVQNYCGLKNQIHEAIVVIDSIIKNYSYELTYKEQTSLNITPFMEKMITEYYQVKQPSRNAHTMQEQFTQADIRQVGEKQITLKNMEAYKRLQMIKRENEPGLLAMRPAEQIYRYETSAMEKEAIREFLEPTHLPKLMNRAEEGNDKDRDKDKEKEKDRRKEKSNDLVTRIEDALNNRELVKKAVEKQKQNKYGLSIVKNHINKEESLSSLRKNASCLLLANQSFVKDKTVKEILGEINTKLHIHKKSKYRLTDNTSFTS